MLMSVPAQASFPAVPGSLDKQALVGRYICRQKVPATGQVRADRACMSELRWLDSGPVGPGRSPSAGYNYKSSASCKAPNGNTPYNQARPGMPAKIWPATVRPGLPIT